VLIVFDGRPVSVITFTIQEGLITELRSVTAPDRLAQIVPSWAV
jgi:RNA polymerase sigma-70 factor, ECF subfamily